MSFRRRRRTDFRELVEQLPLAVYVSALDRTSHAVYVSPAIVDLLGYEMDEWRSTPDLFERAVHPDDRTRVLAAVAASKRTGEPYADEYRMRRADGSLLWVDDKAATVTDARGRPLYWQGFLIDVSDRKEAEIRYRALVEQLPLITYIDSPHSTGDAALYISPQVEEILGHPVERWHEREFFLEHVHPDDRARVAEAQEQARETGEPLIHEYRFTTDTGQIVWLEDMLTIVQDETGKPWYSQGFAVDVTARKLAEAEREQLLARLQRQNERLRELDRMKDEFIALVSHELRTPLTSIRGYLELLVDPETLEDSERASFLGVIERNAERLQRLVEDLLLAAQAEAETLRLKLVEVDLAKIAVDCAEASAPTAAARDIALGCTVLATPTVLGDAGRLAQVVDNLLSNAIKFTPSGGGVHIRVSQSDDAALIEVADSGSGIPQGEHAALFSRFFRTERARRDAVAGVGLGLSIAKALVEAHGGDIDFSSSDEEGTTFRVHLPLAATKRREISGAA